MKILLVEDDEPTAWALEKTLNDHHYTVNLATDGQTGLELATSFDYDLILLDLLMPKLDGISLCRQLRVQGYQKPILLLTAKDSNTDIIQGLDAGADDYVIKPYNHQELMARIRALLRRGNTPVTSSVLTWGELRVNPVLAEVTFREQPLSLTPKEYSLLQLFLRNPQRIFSRSAIIDRLWSLDDSPTENAVTVHIKDLRQKLKASGVTEEIIETVYGLGYRLKALPQPSQPTFTNSTTASIEPSRSQFPTQELDSVNRVLERFRPTFAKRVAGLERTTSALLAGDLSDELRQQARQDAHNLAGSLGTFGYPEGSRLAQQIEHLLMGQSALGQEEASQFKQLVSALGQELTKPPVTFTAVPIPAAQVVRAMLIDDDIALAERLRAEAVYWGVEMAIATNLTAARQAIAQTPVDVILLDLTFSNPSEDGLTLLRELTEQFPSLPVIVLTGRDNLEERVAVSRLGGRGFLHKPVEPKQVFTAIAQALSPNQTAEAKVMIVDDDPAALTILCSLLQPWGFQVTSLENPQQFWEVLTAIEPNLLILDLEMPTFSGIDLCQVVRLDPRWGDLPILVVTAHTDAESLQQVFAAGADDFISKPVVGPELVTRVISRLERVRFRQQLDDIQQKMGKRL